MNQEKYPNQWVGLEEAEYEPDKDATIQSTKVKHINKTKGELTEMQINSNGTILGRYTTQNNVFQLGAMGIWMKQFILNLDKTYQRPIVAFSN